MAILAIYIPANFYCIFIDWIVTRLALKSLKKSFEVVLILLDSMHHKSVFTTVARGASAIVGTDELSLVL